MKSHRLRPTADGRTSFSQRLCRVRYNAASTAQFSGFLANSRSHAVLERHNSDAWGHSGWQRIGGAIPFHDAVADLVHRLWQRCSDSSSPKLDW